MGKLVVNKVNGGNGGLMGEPKLATTLCKFRSVDLFTVKYYILVALTLSNQPAHQRSSFNNDFININIMRIKY